MDLTTAVTELHRLTAHQALTLPSHAPEPALNVLSQLKRLHYELAERQRTSVKLARRGGASWADVGQALGISRQAAQQRYGE